MKLISLSLRGAVGIERGLGQEQIEIDFAQFDDGIVALVAANGSGKTTILENLHPYRSLVSRPGALQNHFYLRDSHRILCFEMAGCEYMVKLLIDAQTGKQESYLYRDGEPLCDGKTTSYDAAVADLFGSEELFFRSLFRGQGSESFAELKPAQRKALFVELLGLSVLEAYQEAAKEHARMRDKDLERLRSEAGVHRSRAASKTLLAGDRDRDKATLAREQMHLAVIGTERAGLDDAIATREDELRAFEAARGRLADLRSERARAREELDRAREDARARSEAYGIDLSQIDASLERSRKILAHRDTILEKAQQITALRTAGAGFEESRRAHDAARSENLRAETMRDQATAAAQAEMHSAEREISRITEQRNALSLKHAHAVAQLAEEIARCEEAGSLMRSVPCAEDMALQGACPLLASAHDHETRLPKLRAQHALLASENPSGDLDVEITRMEATLDALRQSDEVTRAQHEASIAQARTALQACTYDAQAHETQRADLAQLERENWESLASDLATTEALAAQAGQQRASIEAKRAADAASDERRIESADARERELTGAIDALMRELSAADDAADDLAAKQQRRATLRAEAEEIQRSNELLARAVAHAEVRIAECEEAERTAERIEAEAAVVARELEDWTLLVRATGRDGIQALELDAAGPNVSALANQLLAETFGSEFQIAFDTTRTSADGKKQIETFDVHVFAGGTEQTIENLSGGQRVWIEAALSQAIAIYLRRKSGLDLRTSYLDEADGALDADNAFHYLAMLRHSHALAGTHHTFLITHRQELLALIPQQIRLIPGEGIRYEH